MPTIAEKWLQEGMEKGIEKGKVEDACKMISKGMLDTDIIEITGLDRQKIESLRKEINKS